MRHIISVITLLNLIIVSLAASEPAGELRRERAQAFHQRSAQPTGLLVPLYVYPAEPKKNAGYQRVIEAKRRYETVPFWVIVNPASGPGKEVDANYTEAIARLRGAGCVVLGYTTTSYGKRTADDVAQEVEQWGKLYPKVHGLFFDEMIYEDTAAAAKHQAALTQSAHLKGYWPVVANPGAETPSRYFASEAADVIVVHEGNAWPKPERFEAEAYAYHPPYSRAMLLHSQAKFDKATLADARRFARWIYVTEKPYRPGDATAANPWDAVTVHLDELCQALSEK